MDEELIYRKTGRGATELAATHGSLSSAARRVLILLDGRRSLAELTELLGAESVEHTIGELEAEGFARIVDADDALTTQSIPELAEALLAEATAEAASAEAERPRRRGGLGWIVLVIMAGTAGAGGYWFVARADHKPDSTAATVAVNDTGRASATSSDDLAAPTPADGLQGARELPLSGLPPITVTSGTARAAAPAAPAESPAPARRATERAAPPTPESGPEVEPSPSPAFAAPAPAPSPPPQAARPVAVAVAETGRPGRSASDAPPAFAPDGASAGRPAEAATAAESPAPALPAALPATPTPAAAPSDPPAQVAALAPAVQPKSGPVELHPRRHDPPQFPARALRARVLEGHVMAHLWITAEGSVDQVDIVKATPARVFDEEVKRALSAWTFDPPGRAVDTTVDLTFKP